MSSFINVEGIETNNLKNIDVSLEKKGINLIIGPSGSGKSTFMKLLTERIRVKKSTDVPSTSRSF